LVFGLHVFLAFAASDAAHVAISTCSSASLPHVSQPRR
jgi:hypothetical protein